MSRRRAKPPPSSRPQAATIPTCNPEITSRWPTPNCWNTRHSPGSSALRSATASAASIGDAGPAPCERLILSLRCRRSRWCAVRQSPACRRCADAVPLTLPTASMPASASQRWRLLAPGFSRPQGRRNRTRNRQCSPGNSGRPVLSVNSSCCGPEQPLPSGCSSSRWKRCHWRPSASTYFCGKPDTRPSTHSGRRSQATGSCPACQAWAWLAPTARPISSAAHSRWSPLRPCQAATARVASRGGNHAGPTCEAREKSTTPTRNAVSSAGIGGLPGVLPP